MTDLDLVALASKAASIGVTEGLNVALINKACRYFHYCCDGLDDQVSRNQKYSLKMFPWLLRP